MVGFIDSNMAAVLDILNEMINSENYLRKVSALKFLNYVLRNEAHVRFLVFYLSEKQNLKISMEQLNEEEPRVLAIAFQLLHLIVTSKIEKSPQITDTLIKNKSQLDEWIQEYSPELKNEEEVPNDGETAAQEYERMKQEIIDDLERLQIYN